jgi:flagellar protein FliO/FliZ
MTIDYFQALLPLTLVLGLIAAAAWLLQRLTKPKLGKAALLNIQAAISVGPRERVVLLEVAGQWLVLGVAQGQVNTLLTLPAQSVTETDLNRSESALSWLERYTKQSSQHE